MIGLPLRALLPAASLVALAACSSPRAHANVRLTPDDAQVTPSPSTSIAGIGLTVSQ